MDDLDKYIIERMKDPEFKFYLTKFRENPDANLDELEREYHRLSCGKVEEREEVK